MDISWKREKTKQRQSKKAIFLWALDQGPCQQSMTEMTQNRKQAHALSQQYQPAFPAYTYTQKHHSSWIVFIFLRPQKHDFQDVKNLFQRSFHIFLPILLAAHHFLSCLKARCYKICPLNPNHWWSFGCVKISFSILNNSLGAACSHLKITQACHPFGPRMLTG